MVAPQHFPKKVRCAFSLNLLAHYSFDQNGVKGRASFSSVQFRKYLTGLCLLQNRARSESALQCLTPRNLLQTRRANTPGRLRCPKAERF